jgi:anti-sigma factor RsiW
VTRCQEYREAAALDALGALEPDERARLALHLDLCPSCAAYREELERLPPMLDLAAAGPVETLPAGLEDRIVRRYTEESAAAPKGERRPRRSWRLRWAVPALAGLAIGVGATLLALAAFTHHGARQVSVALRGTTAAPGATAVARLDRAGSSTVIRLSGQHLPPSAANQHYEVWMSDGKDTMTAGTFRVGANGTISSTMTCAGDPDEYSSLDVTLEPDEGVSGGARQVILTGNITGA